MKLKSWLFVAAAGCASALTRQCSGKAVNEGGNWYCGDVGHIQYQNVGTNGSYKEVVAMGPDGNCQFQDKPYAGPLAPLNEDLSIHLRGPARLKKLAVYTLSPRRKRRFRRSLSSATSSLWSFAQPQKRADIVTATINGVVVSWENNYFGPQTADPPAAAPTSPSPPLAAPPNLPPVPLAAPQPLADFSQVPVVATPVQKGPASPVAPYPSSAVEQPQLARPDHPGGSKLIPPAKSSLLSHDWDRISYYDAETQASENIIFMGNYGGQGSGVFDNIWGNSLAYLNADGTAGSEGPQILQDKLIPSNKEFSIFTAEKCDESCGFSRAPDVAYKGFGGANKVFLFRFSMPLDNQRGFNGDMPALWLLNGRIPRTGQYSACSCWQSKCGEVDIFETLAGGDMKCKSTFHVSNGAGSSDWFQRPVDRFVTVAVVFEEDSASVSIRILPDDTDFSETLGNAKVKAWVREADGVRASSLFQLADNKQ